MKRFMLFATCAAAITAGVAQAQSITPRGSAGGWGVFLNETTSGCFIQRETAQGIFLQIGTEAALVELTPDDPIGFMSIWIPGLGPNTYFGSAATGTREGYHGATVIAQGSELGFDLRNRRNMTVISSSGARVDVRLNASNISEALDALIECQSSVG